MRKKLGRLTQIEKIVVAFLAIIVVITGFQVGNAFYNEHSDIFPVKGGVYTEGVVGKVGLINPLYVHQGSLTHDLTQLVFSGLSKYDPKTRDVVGDLAEFTVSENGKEYTFTIKENAKWHDGVKVTSDDIIFTYDTVINHPAFNGLILNYNDYSGIKVAKIDERTVQFLLEEADSFFLVKTITGLLPEHVLGHLPVEVLDGAPFNQVPTGSGPYRFISMAPIDNYAEITLEAFEDHYNKEPNIPTIQIKVFSDYKELIKHVNDLDGIRNLPEEFTEKILNRGRLNLIRYHLPQYVAAFINTQSPILKNGDVRLALQLGTDKKSLIESLNQSKIIDTPLLEINQMDWVYQYSVKKANGALYETEWQLPEVIEDEEVIEVDENGEVIESEEIEAEPEYITGPNGGVNWQTTDTKITLTGTTPPKTKMVVVNDYELQKYVPGDPGWSYMASFDFGNLKKGENTFDVYAINFTEEKELIDSITIVQGTENEFVEKELEKLAVENEAAVTVPIRTNAEGQALTLKLITPENPSDYAEVASILKEQWKKIGVNLEVATLDAEAFQEALFKRDYDLLIFGQNLGYNLDAYPYWHSSQAKEGGYNLSQFKNFIVDSLLDKVRTESSDEDRQKTLNDIQEIIRKEVPAVFLYSPTYYFALSDSIQNSYFENLATASDRFTCIADWYGRVNRQFNEGVTPFTFAGWMIKQF